MKPERMSNELFKKDGPMLLEVYEIDQTNSA